jgi:hypothetical protein
MKHGTYCGPIPHLIGKTALLREATHGPVVAQFDDQRLTRSGEPIPNEPAGEPPRDALGFGWHAFPSEHFLEDEHENTAGC